MNRKEFAILFAQKTGEKKGISADLCTAVFDLLADCIKENDRVYIKGLGTFKKKKVKAHRIGDLQNGGVKEIPESEKIIFIISDGNDTETDD